MKPRNTPTGIEVSLFYIIRDSQNSSGRSDSRRYNWPMVKVGVIGAGNMGRHHVRIYAGMDQCELIGVADPNPEKEELAGQYGARFFADYRDLLAAGPELVTIAAPSGSHFELAREAISAGCHLLVEKPISANAHEALGLTEFAEHRNRVMAVGHVERFNPAFVAAQQRVIQPRYVESTRTGGFTFRSMDVGVVLDLMIHDIELVLSLIDSPVKHVTAEGLSVLTSHEDFAVARLEFENGAVAQLKASRVCPQVERRSSLLSSV